MYRRGFTHSVNITQRVLSTASKGRKNLKPRSNRPIIQQQRQRNAELEKEASGVNKDWRIVGATILHRYPVITKDLEPWERDMSLVQDLISTKKKKWLLDQLKDTPAQIVAETDPGYEEIIESLPFTPASRVSEADEKNDRRSLERRLQDSLFLIVKRNRDSHSWQFPQGKWRADETMRDVAERVIDRAVGKVNRYFISNSPQGHYCYKYSPQLQEKRGDFGAKVFFYRSQLITGSVKLETKLYTDYAWIARDEVEEYFDAETAEYMKYLLPD